MGARKNVRDELKKLKLMLEALRWLMVNIAGRRVALFFIVVVTFILHVKAGK